MTRRSLILAAAPLALFRAARAVDSLALFDFRRNFWINLHHFLFTQSLLDPRDREPADGNAAWAAAIAYYNNELISHNLGSDAGLASIKQRLAAIPDNASSAEAGLGAEMVKALDGAAPVYRERWWPAHDRANAAWIQSELPRLSEHGAQVASDLGRVFDFPWPAAPIHTEISYYSSPNGAYTTLDPLFITIASGDARNRGDAGLEILFHEASHGLSVRMRRYLDAALAARLKRQKAPSELWHALIFYCTGDVMRRNLPGYVPYADEQKLWQRAWPGLKPALDASFGPYLDGKGSLRLAVTDLVGLL